MATILLWSPFVSEAQEACEGNFDFDQDVDGVDAAVFDFGFGRSTILNPRTNASPCNGNFACDGDVDGADASGFKIPALPWRQNNVPMQLPREHRLP